MEVVVAVYGSEVFPPVSGIRVIGPVARLSDFYGSVDLALVPVRRGSGIKIKALEGLLWAKRVIVHEHVLDGFPPAVSGLLEPWGDSGPAPIRAVSSDEVVGVGMGADRHPAQRREEVSRMFSQDAVAEQVGTLVERVLRM